MLRKVTSGINGTEIELHLRSDPEDYRPDVHTRLLLYKPIARASRPFTRYSTASRPRMRRERGGGSRRGR